MSHPVDEAMALTCGPAARPAARVSWSSALVLGVVAVMGVLAFGWPLLLHTTGSGVQAQQAPLVFALVLPLVIGVAVVQLGNQDLDVKALALLGVLSAVVAGLRPLGAGTAGLETVLFVIILAGRVLGPGFGFLLGATGMFASALLTAGVGPWLPHQMLASAFVGLGAGLLPRVRGRGEVALLALYGAVVGFVYGWLMDLAFWPFSLGGQAELSYDPTASLATNLHHFALYNLATAMGWNLGRALSNAVLIALLGPTLLRILRRAARRANFR